MHRKQSTNLDMPLYRCRQFVTVVRLCFDDVEGRYNYRNPYRNPSYRIHYIVQFGMAEHCTLLVRTHDDALTFRVRSIESNFNFRHHIYLFISKYYWNCWKCITVRLKIYEISKNFSERYQKMRKYAAANPTEKQLALTTGERVCPPRVNRPQSLCIAIYLIMKFP